MKVIENKSRFPKIEDCGDGYALVTCQCGHRKYVAFLAMDSLISQRENFVCRCGWLLQVTQCSDGLYAHVLQR